MNAHQSQNLTDYIFFSFPNPVCFSPPGPWNMPFYLLGVSFSFPSPAKLLLSLSYILQAALSNYLFHDDKTSCHVFPQNLGGYGVMAYLCVLPCTATTELCWRYSPLCLFSQVGSKTSPLWVTGQLWNTSSLRNLLNHLEMSLPRMIMT